VLVLSLGLAASSAVLAGSGQQLDCARPRTNSERAQCLAAELKGADLTINRIYTELMRALQAPDRTALRDEQRTWITTRDKTCGLASSQGSRDSWLSSLAATPQRAVCVVRLTNERLQTLVAYQEGTTPIAGAATAAPPVYEINSPHTHTRGKFYFEVTVDPRAVLKRGEATLFAGVEPADINPEAVNPNGSGAGLLIPIRRSEVTVDTTRQVFGFALDLDNGKLYINDAGVWDGGAPGSAGGIDIDRARAHRGGVTSSIALNPLLASAAVVVNWGTQPFTQPLPAGYRPLEPR
jgi:uncharacterized protein YecT (DUF1311 family)